MPASVLAAIAMAAMATSQGASLQSDALLLRRALTDLHPGLTRYRTATQEQRDFDRLLSRLAASPTTPQAHAAFAEYLAGIRCGHTFLNPLNQPPEVKAALYDGPDKLPFLYRWVGEEMIVTQAPLGSALRPGDAIESISGVPARTIHDGLLRMARADGGRDETRRYLMSLNGAELEEADAWLPLLAPPQSGQFAVKYERGGESKTATVRAVTRQDRTQQLGLPASYDYDAAWTFEMKENGIGVLKLPHFVTWRMKPTWASTIRNAFRQVKERKGVMFIDLRGCQGGSTDPLLVIAQQILNRPFSPSPTETRTAFRTVPDDLRTLLETWDSSVFDLSAKVKEDGRPGFAMPASPSPTYGPFSGAFEGQVFVATDAANSSGGFLAAQLLKETGRVTLIGQETGGNLRGLNAGQVFFLKLPHSGFRVDVPIYATFPVTPQPDRGVEPDVLVPLTRESVSQPEDPVWREVERRARMAQ